MKSKQTKILFYLKTQNAKFQTFIYDLLAPQKQLKFNSPAPPPSPTYNISEKYTTIQDQSRNGIKYIQEYNVSEREEKRYQIHIRCMERGGYIINDMGGWEKKNNNNNFSL